MISRGWACVLALLMFLAGIACGAAAKHQQAPEPEQMVAMQVVMFSAAPEGKIEELWRIEKETPRPVCWMMDAAFSGAGPKVVTTVKCTEIRHGN